jgi:Zn ribbon nucleic-acid-binding protein
VSHFIHNERCPKCAAQGHDLSADNLGVYSDNHRYCWKCGYYEPGDIVEKHFKQKEIVNSKGLIYPEITNFSQECLEYLRSYQLTDEEIYSNLNGHEDGYSFFDSTFFLVRRLRKKPKVIVKGDVVGKEPIFTNLNGGNTVVVVEDILSAIKVSRVIDTIALLKADLHDIVITRLANRYDNCYLWLDSDMFEKMTKRLLPRIKPYFKQCKVIMSEYDPKTYTDSDIRRFING